MLRKSFLIGVLFISVCALLVTSAYPYPATSGGWGVKPKCVLVWSDWVGVANYEIKPTDVEVTLDLLTVQIHYINPGGQGGGLGTPFYPDTSLTGAEALSDPAWLQKNGKYHSEIEFTDQELFAAIPEGNIPPPPNGNENWVPDPNGPVVVLEMYVTIRGRSDLNDDGTPETETAHVGGTCTLNYDRTAYICVTEENWGYRKSDPACPYE